MRHLRKGKKLGRVSKQRKALLNALAVALIEQGKIKTTLAKAKVLRPFVEKVLTKAKGGGILAVRKLRRELNEKSVRLLMEQWAPLFTERSGGYTRITKLVRRTSDASPMAYIEFVEKPVVDKKSGKKKANSKPSNKKQPITKG